MKTLTEIKHQTRQEKLQILQQVINESFKEPFEASERFLNNIIDKTCNKAPNIYAFEDGYELYTVDIEIADYREGKNDHTQFIDVYIAEKYYEETGCYETYYAL